MQLSPIPSIRLKYALLLALLRAVQFGSIPSIRLENALLLAPLRAVQFGSIPATATHDTRGYLAWTCLGVIFLEPGTREAKGMQNKNNQSSYSKFNSWLVGPAGTRARSIITRYGRRSVNRASDLTRAPYAVYG